MKYLLLSIIQTITSSNAVSNSQESMVMEDESSCKAMQEILIPQPSSSSAHKLVFVDKSGGNITTHTVICSRQRD